VVVSECFQGSFVPIRYLEVVSKPHLRLDSCIAIRFKIYGSSRLRRDSAFKPNRHLLNTLIYKIKT
jgi:hypothetical protein